MLGNHKRAILQFSGGKDSLATLYLARPYLDRITVMFADTGAVYPHLVQYVKDTCAGLGAELTIIEPPMPVLEYTEKFGYPSDMTPAWGTADVSWILREKPKQLLQPAVACCMAMLLLPLQKAIVDSGVTLVIRGAKEADQRRGIPPGTIDKNGVEYASPIWHWTDEDVFAYLKREGAELAPHYGEVKDSLDCWACTAHMPYGDAAAKLAYTKAHYPELWPELHRRLKVVRATVREEQAKIDAVMAPYLEDADADQ